MILGIGIDSTSISEVTRMLEQSESFETRVFSQAEQYEASKRTNKACYYAERFAVKEAAFKAIAHLTEEGSFDLRVVETLNEKDGSPHITKDNALADILREAEVSNLLVSITTEGDLVTAIVLAQQCKEAGGGSKH